MNIEFLFDFVNPVILGICLIAGYCLKTAFDWFENKYIPLAACILGLLLGMIINWGHIDANVVLGGMISGLASTGFYEMLKNLISRD